MIDKGAIKFNFSLTVEFEPVERFDEVDKFEFCEAIEPQFDPFQRFSDLFFVLRPESLSRLPVNPFLFRSNSSNLSDCPI